jgi:hypothetical protein
MPDLFHMNIEDAPLENFRNSGRRPRPGPEARRSMEGGLQAALGFSQAFSSSAVGRIPPWRRLSRETGSDS